MTKTEQPSLAKYIGVEIPPYEKPKIISKEIENQDTEAIQEKKTVLDIEIPLSAKWWKTILKSRKHLIVAAQKDRKKHGIKTSVVHSPVGYGSQYDCYSCKMYEECDKIRHLNAVAEEYGKGKNSNIDKDKLRSIWDYYRVRQRNCVASKVSWMEKKQREENNEPSKAWKDEQREIAREHGLSYDEKRYAIYDPYDTL